MPVVALLVCAAGPARAGDEGRAEPRVHSVRSGQVLGSIARRYGVSVEAICRANAIGKDAVIRAGQKLVIPASFEELRRAANVEAGIDKPDRGGAKTEKSSGSTAKKPRPAKHERPVARRLLPEPPPPGASWAPFMKPAWRRGYVTIQGHGRQWKGYVIGPREQVLPLARQRISHVLASWRTGKEVLVDDRLVRLLAHVSDVFGGRPIRIVSGYREKSYAPKSKHKLGRAVDFSIPGVPNAVVRDYLRTLSDVGVGYYPNSTHVHLDVRQKSGYWVDYSRPGQPPKYRRKKSRDGRVAVRTAGAAESGS